MAAETTAVLRFSSLGDVLLAAHVPSFLKRLDPERRVLFVTRERYARVLDHHPHIDRFYMLEEKDTDPAAPSPFGVRGPLGYLMSTMRLEGVKALLDLHANLRSARVMGAFPGARRTTAPKHALRRRVWVHARWLGPATVPPVLETYRALVGLPGDAPLTPWLREALTPDERRRAEGRTAGGRPFVLLGVGARWNTKRWPLRHFVALAEGIERGFDLGARFALAPEETAVRSALEHVLPPDRHPTIDALPFRALGAVAARAEAIVSNDSAVLHLGPAVGVPSIGIFGSTVPELGFGRQGPGDQAVGIPLPCRPCDVHGKAACPLRHHNCMERLEPKRVLEALGTALEGAGTPSKGALS